MNGSKNIDIVGAGLAGMTAAFRLRQLGYAVTLHESSEFLGGQAGSKLSRGRWQDHGYHVVFPWYLNMRAMMAELGIIGNFVELAGFHQLRKGAYPNFGGGLRAPKWDPLREALAGLGLGDRICYYYMLADLVWDEDGDESIASFLNRRWYSSEPIRREMDRLVAAACTPATDYSTRTLRTLLSAFARHNQPACGWKPNRSLQESLIAPFRRRLEDIGVEVKTGWRMSGVTLDGGERATELVLQTPQGEVRRRPAGIVLAVPHHEVARLGSAFLERSGLAKNGFDRLRSHAESALHLYTERPIAHLPKEHFWLVESRYEISMLDVSSWNPGPGSALSLVLGASRELLPMAPEDAARAVVDEAQRYIPSLTWDNIADFGFLPNTDAPLFSNDANSWAARPEQSTGVHNVWLAGDYTRTHVDAACMENAVTSGVLAANAVQMAEDPTGARIPVLRPKPVSRREAAAAKMVLFPFALGARLAAYSRRKTAIGSTLVARRAAR